MFIFYDKSNILYDGLAQLKLDGSNDKVESINYKNSNRETKLTINRTTGLLCDNPDETKYIISIGGIINDKDIKEVHVLYSDNQSVVIKVDPKYNTYFHSRFENNIYIKEIKGLNGNGKELYSESLEDKP